MDFYCKYCNKKCKSKLSKSCHERFCQFNPNKADKSFLHNNAIRTNNILKEKRKNNIKSLKKITFELICENCGSKFYIIDYENRKKFPKCCSSFCSHSLNGKTNNKGTKEVICIQCGNIYTINKHNSKLHICDNCKKENKEKLLKQQKQYKEEKLLQAKLLQEKLLQEKILQDKTTTKKQRILSEKSIQKLRDAGKKSAKIQSEIRRSKNEIKFCQLCEEYFNNVEHNQPIFNGWDADVIIHDIKYAILWNGKVHYEPIFGQANLNRVLNRDKIKIKEIENSGYIPYIIKDIGKFNDNFVKEKFNEFIDFLNNDKINT